MPVKPAPYVNRSCKPAPPPLPVKKYRQSLNYQSSKTISGPPKIALRLSMSKTSGQQTSGSCKQSLKSSIMSTLRRSF